MDSDLWAKTSFKISSTKVSYEALVDEFGPPMDTVRGDTWIWDVEKSSDQPLQEQLQELEHFLSSHLGFLRELSNDSAITVNFGWCPRVPQDGIGFSSTLIALLGKIGVRILIDTYVDAESPKTYPDVLD